jgi:hypothetical protein
VQFTGTTTGCYYDSANAACAGADFVDEPSFRETSFNGRTNVNFGTTNAAGTLNGIDLGTLALGIGPDNCLPGGCPNTSPGYDTRRFRLQIEFSAPGGSGIFSAILDGTFASGSTGVLEYNFGGFQNITFSNSSGSGAFDLRVNDQSLLIADAGRTRVELTGDIRNATFESTVGIVSTPEPASIALFATGLVGVAGGAVVRRRRR